MYKTHVRPIRDIRNNYAELDKIVNDHDHVIITNNGRGTSVLIGIEEYRLLSSGWLITSLRLCRHSVRGICLGAGIGGTAQKPASIGWLWGFLD